MIAVRIARRRSRRTRTSGRRTSARGAVRAALAAAALALVVVARADAAARTSRRRRSLIAVDAPFSRSPYIGQTIARGVELAVERDQRRRVSGQATPSTQLKVKRYDNALSPRKALSNVRRAIADGAVAIVDDGTGVDASWEVANKAKVPICITYDGGNGLVDLEQRPNVFRIAPTDRGISFSSPSTPSRRG